MPSHIQRVLVAAVASFLVFVACRDLDYPGAGSSGSQNGGPTVAFTDPAGGSRVALRTQVRLTAGDVNGVSQVNLSCGNGIPVRRWIASPYEDEVDLTPCVPPGPGLQQVTLTADGVDSLGATGAADTLILEVDPDAASLIVELPERATPGSTLEAIVRSDRELQAAPVVRVEGASATVTSLGGNVYRATLSPLPGLGAELVPPGTATTEQLLQTERLMGVTIEARSLSGNPTRIDRTVLLSRALWARAVTEDIRDPNAGFPYAGAAPSGLQVPVASGAVVTLDPASGSLSPPYGGSLDAGATLGFPTILDFDQGGHSYLGLNAGQYLVNVPGAGTVRGPFNRSTFPTVFASLPDSICGEQDTSGTCALQLSCDGNAGGTASYAISGAAGTFAPSADISTSGTSYLLVGTNCCANRAAVGNELGGVCLGKGASGRPIFPTGAGGFVLENPVERLGPAGTFTALPQDSPPSAVVAARVDGTTLQVKVAGEQSTFEVRGTAGLISSRTLAGSFTPFVPSVLGRTSRDRVFVPDPDLSVTALLIDDAQSVYVARFAPDGTPRWFYRVGTTVNGRELFVSSAAYLRAAPSGPVYFVEPLGDRVVAFSR